MRKHHPYASLFPVMGDDEIQALAEDIKQNGQRNEVIIDSDGLVLDGRNRLAACLIAGITPLEYVFEGTEEEKLNLVLSLNLQRRHLNESQRSMVAARWSAELKSLQGQIPDVSDPPAGEETANLPRKKRPRDVAAERLAVSPRSVQDAATVLQSGDAEAIAAVDRGEAAVSAQAKRVRAQTAVTRGEHVAGSDGGAIVESAAPKRRSGGLSREEKAAIRRDITAMVRGYPAPVRGDVAVLVVDQCQRLLIGIRPGGRETMD